MRFLAATTARFVILMLVLFGASACATLQPKLEGTSGTTTWRATNLGLSKRTVGGLEREVYEFVLAIRDSGGAGITFTRIERAVYQPGSSPGISTQEGRWRLEPKGELRLPYYSFQYCERVYDRCVDRVVNQPLWKFVFSGMDDRGQKVRLDIDLQLPSAPAPLPSVVARPPVSDRPPTPVRTPVEVPTTPTTPTVDPKPGAVAPSFVPAPQPVASGSSGVPVQIAGNLVLVPVTLNRTQGATLLLDTGAAHTVISRATAQRLGLVIQNAPRQTLVLGGQRRVEVPFVSISSIQVGNASLENIAVAVFDATDDSMTDGVLGGDFLGRFRVTIDQSSRRLLLETPSRSGDSAR
jgi:hypothetical protein